MADSFAPFVSIIIPVFNGQRTIQKCLDAVLTQDYGKERYEVIVVDNNSTDDTPQIVSQYPVQLLYERDMQGPHAATNTGIHEAKGEILVFTDSDCVPVSDWLSRLVAPFSDPDVVAAGGRIEAYQPTTRIERFLQNEVQLFRNCMRLSADFPASIITGNAAYRARTLHQVGLFNANLYTGAEVDLAWRVQLQTEKKIAYVDQAIVYHIFTPTLGRMFRHFRIYGYSEILLDTLYKDVSDYPRPLKKQLRLMLSQCRALVTYTVSFFYHVLSVPWRGKNLDYVLFPVLWWVAECGNLYGKLGGLADTRFCQVEFWVDGPKAI
jgi:cellulose synthase/poly-beta-1,6-N-acetylglucosamine synthase-like glycosyltransferase